MEYNKENLQRLKNDEVTLKMTPKEYKEHWKMLNIIWKDWNPRNAREECKPFYIYGDTIYSAKPTKKKTLTMADFLPNVDAYEITF